MGIFRNNEQPELDTNHGSKVSVKRGRLGSGSYWPAGTPISGNVWGPNTHIPMTNAIPADRPFGSPGNAGNGTWTGQSRVTTGLDLPHPNAGFQRTSLQNKVPAITRDGDGTYRTPHGPNPVIQPHEKNSLMHRKVLGIYRTVSGASRTLPSDTAFHRVPPKEKPKPIPTPQTNTLKIMNSKAAPPSFVSRNTLWYDPNNSYLGGKPQAISGEHGRGRWSTIKRGAAG